MRLRGPVADEQHRVSSVPACGDEVGELLEIDARVLGREHADHVEAQRAGGASSLAERKREYTRLDGTMRAMFTAEELADLGRLGRAACGWRRASRRLPRLAPQARARRVASAEEFDDDDILGDDDHVGFEMAKRGRRV